MTGNRTVNTVFGYTVDQGSVSQAVAANTHVAETYNTMAAAVATFNTDVLALNPGLAKLAESEGAVAIGAQAINTAYGLSVEQLKALDAEAEAFSTNTVEKYGLMTTQLKVLGEQAAQFEAASARAPATGLLAAGSGDAGVALGFMRDLAAIQAQEAAAQGAVTDQVVAQNEQLEIQGTLTQRLADAALVRESAESGVLAQLREEAFAAKDAANANAGDSGGSEAGGGINLGGLRGGLRAGGFLLGADAGGGGLRAAGQIITLTSVLGPLGVVAGVAAVALRAATEAEQKRTEAAKEYIAALAGTAGETTADLQKQIDQEKQNQASIKGGIDSLQSYGKALEDNRANVLKHAQDVAAAQANGEFGTSFSTRTADQAAALQASKQASDDLQASFIDLNAQIYDATQGAYGFKDGVGTFINSSDEFKGALDEGQAKLKVSSDKIAFLGVQFDSLATQENNLAEANHKLALSQEDGAKKALEVDRLTKAQRDERAAQDLRDINVLTRLVGEGKLNEEALKNVAAQIDVLNADYKAVTEASDTYADQLAREEELKNKINDATNNYFDAITAENEAIQQTIQTQNNLKEASVEHADKLVEIQTEEHDKEAEDRKKAAQSAEEDTRKHLLKLNDISNDAAADHEADVGNRDALANYKDAAKAVKDRQKEDDNFAEQERTEQEHLNEQLQSEQVAQRKSENQENTSYTKRYNDLVRSLNDAQVAQSRAEGLATAYQSVANQGRLVAEVNHQNMMLGAAAQGYKSVEGAFVQHLNNLAAIAGGHDASGNSTMFLPQVNLAPYVETVVNKQVAKIMFKAQGR